MKKKRKPKLAKDFNELLRKSSTKSGAIDLSKMDAQAVRGPDGLKHDVQFGPCSCGGWHD